MSKNQLVEPDYKALFEEGPGLFMVLDPDLRIVAASDAWLRATMNRREEILGRYVFDVVPDNPDDPNADSERNSLASFNRVLRTGETDVMVVQRHDVRNPESNDGEFETRYWSPINSPIMNPDGSVAYILHRVENVTEFIQAKQQEAEQADALRERTAQMEADLYARSHEVAEANLKLKQANEDQAHLLDLAHVLIRDADDRIVSWNTGAEMLYGFTKEEAIGRVSHDLLKTVFPVSQGATSNILAATGDWQGELVHTAKDGQKIVVASHWILHTDEKGEPIATIEVNNDITDQKQAEEAASESEDRLAFALETIDTGAWDLDLIDHTAHRSLGHDRVFGYSELLPEWTYEMFLEHVLPEDRADVDQKFHHAMETHGDWSFECRIRRTDGEVRWILAAGRHRKDNQGEVRRMTGIVQDITERRRAEDALRDSEQRLRRFYEAGLLGVIYWNMDGKITDANDKFLEMVGYTREELDAGQIDWQNMTPPEYRHLDWLSATELRTAGVNKEPFEKEFFRKDGSRLPVVVAGAMLDEARFNGVAFAFDITQRKQAEKELQTALQAMESINEELAVANEDITSTNEELRVANDELSHEMEERALAEEALRDNQSRLEAVFAAIPDVIVEYDADGKLVRANEAALRVAGFGALNTTRDQVVAKLRFTNVDGSAVKYRDLPTSRALRGETVIGELYAITTVDGMERVVSTYSAPLYREGEIKGVVALWHDVTERRRAEEALAESEERLRLAQQVAKIGTFEWNIQTGVNTWTPELEAMYGLPPGGFPGTQGAWESMVHPDDRDEAIERVSQAIENGGFEAEFRVIWPDGSVHWLAGRAWVFKDEAGNPLRLLGVNIDISELKLAEEQTRRLLAEVQEEKDRLSTLIDSVNDEIWFADAEKRLVLVNRAVTEEFGVGLADIAEVERIAAQYEVYRADGTPRPVDEAPPLRALNGEVVKDYDEIVRTPATGELRHRSVNASPVRDPGGKVIGSVSVVRDITEAKKAQEAVRRSQETFSELVERAPFGIYVIDSEFRIAQMNTASQNGAFRNVRPLIGRDFQEAMRILWPEDVAEGIISVFRHTLETGEPYYSPRFVNPRHDVEVVEAYEWELHRMTLPDGQYGVICYYYDSTALREAEEALRESERRERERAAELATMLDAVPTPVIIVHDPEGLHMTGNRATDELLRQPSDAEVSLSAPEEIRPRHFRAVKDGCELRLDELPAQRAARGEQVQDFDFSLVFDDGATRHVLGYGTPLFDDKGLPRGAVHVLVDITERKRSEEALRVSEAELTEAQAIAHIGSWHWDVETDVTTGSDELLRIYGLDPATQSMPDFKDQEGTLYPAEDWQRINEAVQETMRTGVGYKLDVQAIRNGEPVWVTTQSEVVKNENGNIVALRGTVQDITERKKAEEALTDSEERFRLMGDTIPYGAWMADAEGRNIYISPLFLELVGMTFEQVKEFGWTDKMPPEDVEPTMQRWTECVRTGRDWEGELRFPSPDGQWHTILSRGKPVRDVEGQIKAWVGINLDITERKQAEESLRESENRFRTMADAIPQLAWMAEADGFIFWYNRRWYEYTGTTREQMEGWGWQSVHDPEALPKVMDRWKESIATGQPFDMEFPLLGADGKFRAFLTRVTPMKDSEGRVWRWFGTNTDVSQSRELEASKQEFYRRTILAATEGKLMICEKQEIEQVSGPAKVTWKIGNKNETAEAVDVIGQLVRGTSMEQARVYEFMGCVTEAVANVIKHANGGVISLHNTEDGLIAVATDSGSGIAAMSLPDVALTKYYSTAGTLGMGYKLMLHFADKVYLSTGPEGTTVAIEMKLKKPEVHAGVRSQERD